MTLIAGVVMLGILIFIHELGHFCLAKLFRVKVLTFSLGFGPKLFGRQKGETEYRLSAFPLGGYVQMLGEGTADEAGLDEMDPEELHRAFALQPLWQRFAIVAAGPTMNLLLPFLVLPVAFMIGVQSPAYLDRPACIGYVAPDSPAQSAGFHAGDCIQAVNGHDVESWQKANETFVTQAGEPLHFTIERGGVTRELELQSTDAGVNGLQPVGLLPQRPAVIDAPIPGHPAAAAGLQGGDQIVRIGAMSIRSWYQLRDAVARTGGKPTEVEVERAGKRLVFVIQPEAVSGGSGYLLGVAPRDQQVTKRYGLPGALRAGAGQAVDLMQLTLVFLQKLVTGSVSTKNIGGPITVFQYAGQAAQTDFSAVLTMLAFLSIQLGILNLLPIPVLDGGHLFFYSLEFVLRRPLPRRARELAQQAGLALLVLLMLLATYNDLLRIFF